MFVNEYISNGTKLPCDRRGWYMDCQFKGSIIQGYTEEQGLTTSAAQSRTLEKQHDFSRERATKPSPLKPQDLGHQRGQKCVGGCRACAWASMRHDHKQVVPRTSIARCREHAWTKCNPWGMITTVLSLCPQKRLSWPYRCCWDLQEHLLASHRLTLHHVWEQENI